MLQVIKAEEVRDGEPRWWLADECRRLDYMKPEHLHLHPRSCEETTHAIVDRPAPTPPTAPGLDLDAPLLVGCALHDGADIDACGCPALDSPDSIAYRGLLVNARAEIARLTAELAALREHVIRRMPAYQYDDGTPVDGLDEVIEYAGKEIAELRAELAAARAVPADVEAAILTLVGVTICEASRPPHSGDDPSPPMDVARNALRTAIARAISDATAARGTVGGLLATDAEAEARAWCVECDVDILNDGNSGERCDWLVFIYGEEDAREARDRAIDRLVDEGHAVDAEAAEQMVRIVPLVPFRRAEADLDPKQRGPLPKGG